MSAQPVRDARLHRSSRVPAPPLPDIETLDATHQSMLDMLKALSRLLDRLEVEGIGPEARASAREICAFFDGHARQHHAAEEAHVFPALLRDADAELVQHIQRLQQDHGWLEEDWIELEPQLKAVSEGYSWYNLDELRAGVNVFTALSQDHIALEESLIYPLARKLDVPPTGR
jgi:hemerythrin-like domain-containing protein